MDVIMARQPGGNLLERAGLIVRSREAQWRPSGLQAEPLDQATEWMQARKRTWESRMDRLEANLHTKKQRSLDE